MAKSMVIGVILAIIFGGIGLMYAGRVGLGLVLFLLELALSIAGTVLSIMLIGIPLLIIAFVIWIIAIVLTVKTINKANGTNY